MLYAKALQQPQEAAKLESILNYFEVMIGDYAPFPIYSYFVKIRQEALKIKMLNILMKI